jgi:hypothetical protein
VLAAARAEANKYKRLAAERDKELEALRAAAMSDQDKAVAAAKAAGADEYKVRYARAMATNAVLSALAAKNVVAPELAIGAMDLTDLDVDLESGRVDPAVVAAKIDDVIKRYPMLVTPADPRSAFAPLATGGDQRRVTAQDLSVGPKGQHAAPDENLLRWALGGGKPPA